VIVGGLKKKEYEEHLEEMHVELNNLARWLRHTGRRATRKSGSKSALKTR